MSAFPDDVMDTARLIAGCVEDGDDCATHEPCAWPCRSQAVERIARVVADRERAAAARALRGAADDLGSVTYGRTSEALSHWPDHDRGIYELAIEEASGKIHERADELEAGEGRG